MNSKAKEDDLVRSIVNGDKQRFVELIEAYQVKVANLTYKLAGNRLEVDEVVQLVFVELYTSLPRFRFESKLSTFVYRITVNVVNKMLTQARRVVPFEKETFVNRFSTEGEEGDSLQQEQLEQLRNAIGQLKYEQRTALVLFTYDNFTYQDIADVMNISISKVESLIFRAKKNLKKILKLDD